MSDVAREERITKMIARNEAFNTRTMTDREYLKWRIEQSFKPGTLIAPAWEAWGARQTMKQEGADVGP